jgi:acetyltransferase-like isoleucine patch superfamily enzyme
MTLKQKLFKLTDDNGSHVILRLRNFRLLCLKHYSSAITRCSLFVKGIKVGTNNQFYGRTFFSRYPLSKIIIGNNCVFRSDKTSNLIGLNHKCMISTLREGAEIIIGNNCGFSGVTLGAAAYIKIGNNVMCGANSIITDTDWHTDISKTEPKKVVIQDNVWIGGSVTILKGVTIGANSIIGANSLVARDIPANVVAGGNPCKILKEINW